MDFVEIQDLSPVTFEKEVHIVNTYPRKVLDVKSGITISEGMNSIS